MAFARKDKQLIRSIHLYQRHKQGKGPVSVLLRTYAKILYAFWSTITGADINRNVQISASVRLPHPNGVVIHKDAVIGDDCQIMQQVTIGQLADTGAPVLKKGCYIGSGAKVLGEIILGENARVGANAVVLQDVPPGCTAVGVPAKVLEKKE